MMDYKPAKINGVSFVASRDSISNKHIKPVVSLNANYVAVMPFGFIKELQHPEIVYNTGRQWFGETNDGVKQYIDEFNKEGLSVMLKPQIWVWRGEYTGNIKMDSEENWSSLETSYSKFILDYAQLAQEMKVEILCIGTELEQFIVHRPQFWKDLIGKIRSVYDGKLTYAANWDEFKSVPFWSQLDYIGVDAYFPISNSQTPTVEECLEGWLEHKVIIEMLSEQYSKPVLFTEFGYRSVDFSGKKPWDYDRNNQVANLEAQVNTTQALFETFWQEDWFAGGFVWKWFHDHEKSGGETNNQFTPQNKPVELLIQKQYKTF
ncbi:glycoside hydrolase family 113 [Bizionia arctica]|nr:glycoside hydrolase [Bizionia arctica]